VELFAIVGLGILTACVVAPMTRFSRAMARGKAMWPRTVVRTLEAPLGAYRSSTVREERTIHAPPRFVEIVAIVSAFMGMAWLPSLPIVGLGLAVEADKGGGPGPALVFGLTGMALSIGIFVTGPRLLERRRVGGARLVGWWAILHNVAILVAMILVSTAAARGEEAGGAWMMYSLTEPIGWIALGYVLFSIAHAIALLRAAKLCEVTASDDLDTIEFAAALR
jgi:hypothetical protein